MINVSVYRSQGGLSGFEISGHAESGPYGHDLVCAAVSAVSFGTVNAIISLCDIELDIAQGGEGGFLHVKLPPHLEQETLSKARLLLEGMLVSLQTIENDYHEYIRIKNM
ncbi:ribosomal-processing cysteine protease Prp [Halobacillus sp. Marseille-P3879]|uniref:ribosomal-processing cysteine protease Prp n=1 Tax=Halobacillus sp. Marseille-P3879 TaxID=2045014 RepID=UPI000C7994CC|nr:ribosomal-processing cysteine protease Prp [Halobacillus sp. Marseille-P3879]